MHKEPKTQTKSKSVVLVVVMKDLPKGADHGECEPITGVQGWSPSRVQGQVGAKREAESFLSIFIQKRGQQLRV